MKPELPADRKLASVSRNARLTFVYLWTIADDDGLFRAEPRQLLGDLYPHDADVTTDILEGWVGELAAIGVIRWRQTRDGARIGEIGSWAKHQVIKNRSKPHLLNELLQSSGGPGEEIRSPSGEAGGAEPRVLSLEPRAWSQESKKRGDDDGSDGSGLTAVRSPVEALVAGEGFDVASLTSDQRSAFLGAFRGHADPKAFAGIIRGLTQPMGGKPVTVAVVAQALLEMRATSPTPPLNPRTLRAYVQKVGQPVAGAVGAPGGDMDFTARARAYADELRAKEGAP